MAMQAWAERPEVNKRYRHTGMRVWRSSTDGAGESTGAAITIPVLDMGTDAIQVGILGMRANITGVVTPGGSQGFRIQAGHDGGPMASMRMLSPDGYTDRVSVTNFDNDMNLHTIWAGMSSNGGFGVLNHVLTWTKATVLYTEGTNTGGLLQWVELWSFPCFPGAGNPLVLR